jgi:hypothetical protein
MQMMLRDHRDSSLRSYFLWGSYIRSDNETAARENSERFVAPNAVHYWTPTPKLAEDLSNILRLPAGKLAWDVFLLYSKGALWDDRVPAPQYWQHQLEVLQGEPFDVTIFDAHVAQALQSR